MTREKAIQELQNCKGLIQQDGQDYLDERDIPLLDMAIEALSAEAVEVVRCKDCKWYGHIGCAIEIKDDSDRPKPDDFCSFGERRGDGRD